MAVNSSVLESFGRYAARCEAADRRDPVHYRRRIKRWEQLGQLAAPLLFLGQWVNGGEIASQAAQIQSTSNRSIPFPTSDLFEPATDRTAQLLMRDDAPAFFAMIDELSAAEGAPGFSAVYLIHAPGAWVTADQPPHPNKSTTAAGDTRTSNCLYLGRDLIANLRPSELRAVVAHELGHSACGHHPIASRLDIAFRNWAQLGDGASHGSRRGGMASCLRLPGVARFARWYARRLLAHACPVFRNAEFEADRYAARLTSSDAMCSALIRIAILQTRASGFSKDNFSDAEILEACLHDDAKPDARHPALRERLAALGWDNRLPQGLTNPASNLFAARCFQS